MKKLLTLKYNMLGLTIFKSFIYVIVVKIMSYVSPDML